MASAGLDGEIQITQGYFTFRSGLLATEQLLDAGRRPPAIFASNDDMAAARRGDLDPNGRMAWNLDAQLGVGYEVAPEVSAYPLGRPLDPDLNPWTGLRRVGPLVDRHDRPGRQRVLRELTRRLSGAGRYRAR